MSEHWCWKNSIDLPCILEICEKKFFFLKFFQPIKIREKIKLNSSIFLSLESRDQWTVMLKKFYWPLLNSPNPREKFFFHQNFSTNEILRKNQIQFFDFFLIGIERWVNSDAEKILLTFVVFSKSGRKNFCYMKIFRPMRFREKIKFNYSSFFSLESRDQWTVMLKKFYWTLLYSPNAPEKIFFSEIFSTNQNSRKNQIQLFEFFLIGIERWVNTDAEKIPLTFVVFSRSAPKIFFLSKFFDQWDFEKKSNSTIRFFCHWNRETSEHWRWKNSIDLRCILQIREKKIFFLKFFQPIRIREKIKFNSKIFFSLESRDEWTLMLKKFHWPSLYSWNRCEKIFFFYQNFWTNEISRKNQIQLFDFFLIGIERWVNSDAEKIPLTFVVFSKSSRQNLFFSKIFQPIRFREKIKFNSSTFSPLESRDEWTLIRRKLFSFSRNPCFPGEAMKNMYCSLFCSNFYLFKVWDCRISLLRWNKPLWMGCCTCQ